MQSWTDEYLQKVVDVCAKHVDQNRASAILEMKPSSIERVLREARARGISPSDKPEVPAPPNVLIMDIETSLMTFFGWSPGKQYVGPEQIIDDWHILSWSCKWLFEPDVYSDVLTPEEAKNRDDKRVVESMWHFLDKADIIIAHNGKRFDVRKLNARYMIHDMIPYSPIVVIDTLLIMRSVALMSSNKQDELAKRFGLQRKVEHEGYDLWKKCYYGDPESLLKMEEYNRGDVTGLEELYVYIRGWIKNHPNMSLFVEGDGHQCPNCGGSNISWMDKFYYTPMNKYSCFRCGDCGAIGRSPAGALDKTTKPALRSIAR